jgi:hypothetical protein
MGLVVRKELCKNCFHKKWGCPNIYSFHLNKLSHNTIPRRHIAHPTLYSNIAKFLIIKFFEWWNGSLDVWRRKGVRRTVAPGPYTGDRLNWNVADQVDWDVDIVMIWRPHTRMAFCVRHQTQNCFRGIQTLNPDTYSSSLKLPWQSSLNFIRYLVHGDQARRDFGRALGRIVNEASGRLIVWLFPRLKRIPICNIEY